MIETWSRSTSPASPNPSQATSADQQPCTLRACIHPLKRRMTMKLTENHKKLIWIAAGVIALVHFGPRLISTITANHQAPPKPSPAVIAAPAPPPPVVAPA